MTCTACNNKLTTSAYVGFFTPRRPEAFGGRVLPVQLCERCRRKGRRHWTRAVEEALARRAAAPRN
jgi:hypothetical protein